MNTLNAQMNYQQQGAVLILALILLVVLTMLGISAIEATKLEIKMAANTKNYNRAFQHAEDGISKTIDFYLKNKSIKKPTAQLTTLEEAHQDDSVENPVDIDDDITEVRVMAPGKAIGDGSIFWQPILVESVGKLKRNEHVQIKIVAGLIKPVPKQEPLTGNGSQENEANSDNPNPLGLENIGPPS